MTNDGLNTMTYAPDGDVLTGNDSVNGNWPYGYDPFNRLISSNKNSGQQTYSYAYDRFGNRWQQNAPQGGSQFIATFTGNNPGNPQNNNRMDGYSYDAAGNLLNDGSHTYFYDAENRIIQVGGTLGTCSTATACYVYDANGQRIRKTKGSTTVDYLYDLAGHEIVEVSSTGTWNRAEIYAGARHLATYANGATGVTYFNHADWLGTERMRTNMSAASCETITSLPFGDGQTTSGSCGDPSPMHFTGKERDSESGLDNFTARYFGSGMGRFMSPDPVAGHAEDPQTLNRYVYVRNNPLNLTDPTGLDFNLSCSHTNNNKATCQKDAAGNWVKGTTTTTTDANGNTTSTFTATVVTSASLQDRNSGNTATVNQNGVQITTANGTSQGVFISGTAAANNVQGSGSFGGFSFNINGNCNGTCLASGSFSFQGPRDFTGQVLELRGAFRSVVDRRIPGWGKSLDEWEFHPGTEQYRFGTGPSPHFSLPDNPKNSVPTVGPFHVDKDAPGAKHLGCAWFGVGCN